MEIYNICSMINCRRKDFRATETYMIIVDGKCWCRYGKDNLKFPSHCLYFRDRAEVKYVYENEKGDLNLLEYFYIDLIILIAAAEKIKKIIK